MSEPKNKKRRKADECNQMNQPVSARLKKLNLNYPNDIPNNTINHKYFICEPDPLCPESTNKELDYHGGIIPSKHYRRWWPEQVLLNTVDAAPSLVIDNEKSTVIGNHGYSTVRASHSMTEGNYYFEVNIMEMPKKEEDSSKVGQDDSCCRVGFSTDKHCLENPVGYGNFSFGIRAKKMTIFHNGKGKHYVDGPEIETGKRSFDNYKIGDTIGCRIFMTKNNSKSTSIEYAKMRKHSSIKGKKYKAAGTNDYSGNMASKRRRKNKNIDDIQVEPSQISKYSTQNNLKTQNDGVLITYKGFYYFESLDLEPYLKNYKGLPTVEDIEDENSNYCEIEFYKNHRPLGIAFSSKNINLTSNHNNFPIGEYFPTISCYRSCKVSANFNPDPEILKNLKQSGPEFVAENFPIKPFEARVKETTIEATVSDLLFHVEDKIAFRKFEREESERKLKLEQAAARKREKMELLQAKKEIVQESQIVSQLKEEKISIKVERDSMDDSMTGKNDKNQVLTKADVIM